LSGFKPFEDIDIIFTGVRPGEKLFEELETSEEHLTKTRHRKIFIGQMATLPQQKMAQVLRWLILLSKRGREQELRNYLTRILPESRLEPGDPSQPHIKIESATFDRRTVDAEPKRYASAGR
jgi:FlaA1/EpsC-like NDP-sugar epimerase